MTNLCQANIEVLNQLIDLIQCCDENYSTKNGPVASIGEHTRHILDHYRAVKIGISNDCINYNLRTRDSDEESDALIAESQINSLIVWLSNLEYKSKPIELVSEISVNATLNETLASSLERELLYLINHSIHHLAYAALAAKTLGISVPNHIGVAPSTATYRRNHQHKEAC
ncbi:hypothetical protein [Reinekea marinisedimentorum]|uniref:DinB family protein n=1 Tax=Reinekea marinisedimentorum TaxID=230495 RepID=A0A4R3I826_9GAMM|nr:hypothetical protein [Reinekea marinisedimentorum]TCS41382.1 hypothetical protein BCF53_106113 [Reinekea marinisedimentorum]